MQRPNLATIEVTEAFGKIKANKREGVDGQELSLTFEDLLCVC